MACCFVRVCLFSYTFRLRTSNKSFPGPRGTATGAVRLSILEFRVSILDFGLSIGDWRFAIDEIDFNPGGIRCKGLAQGHDGTCKTILASIHTLARRVKKRGIRVVGQIDVEALGRHIRAAELVPNRSARRHLERHAIACPLMMVVESADNDMGAWRGERIASFPLPFRIILRHVYHSVVLSLDDTSRPPYDIRCSCPLDGAPDAEHVAAAVIAGRPQHRNGCRSVEFCWTIRELNNSFRLGRNGAIRHPICRVES